MTTSAEPNLSCVGRQPAASNRWASPVVSHAVRFPPSTHERWFCDPWMLRFADVCCAEMIRDLFTISGTTTAMEIRLVCALVGSAWLVVQIGLVLCVGCWAVGVWWVKTLVFTTLIVHHTIFHYTKGWGGETAWVWSDRVIGFSPRTLSPIMVKFRGFV